MCGPHAAPFPVGHQPNSSRSPARALIPCTARSPRDTHPKARACYPDIGTANARVRLPGRNGSRATVFIGDRCPLEGQSSLDLGMVRLMGKRPDSCDCVLAARVMLPCFPNIIGLCTFAFCENPIFFFKMVWIAPGRNWPCFDNIQCYWRP